MTEETKYLQIKITGSGPIPERLNLAWLMGQDREDTSEQRWIFEGVLRMFKAIRKDDVSYIITTVTPKELISGTVLVKDVQEIIDHIAEWMS